MSSKSTAMSSTARITPHPTRQRSKFISLDEQIATVLILLSQGTPLEDEPHKCSICGKGFNSFRALCGHKACHRFNKRTEARLKNEEYTPSLEPSGKVHRCMVCSKTFATGQALGGHKRCHYEGLIKVTSKVGKGAACSSENGSEVVSAASATAKASDRGFELDLNMPPEVPEFEPDGCYRANDEEVLSPLASKKPRFSRHA